MTALVYALLVVLNAAAAPAALTFSPDGVLMSSDITVSLNRTIAPSPQGALARSGNGTIPTHSLTQALRDDAWLGADKFRHFWSSYAATAFGFAAARSLGVKSETALPLGMAAAAAAGVGKELHDREHGSFISVRDMIADALGIGAAFFLLRELH